MACCQIVAHRRKSFLLVRPSFQCFQHLASASHYWDGVAAFVAGKRESKWMWAANAARVVEVGLGALVMWASANIVGYL
jgi:hypothetical protein